MLQVRQKERQKERQREREREIQTTVEKLVYISFFFVLYVSDLFFRHSNFCFWFRVAGMIRGFKTFAPNGLVVARNECGQSGAVAAWDRCSAYFNLCLVLGIVEGGLENTAVEREIFGGRVE